MYPQRGRSRTYQPIVLRGNRFRGILRTSDM